MAVLETGVSRHHGGPIEAPPTTLRTSQPLRIEGFKGLRPIMPRNAVVSRTTDLSFYRLVISGLRIARGIV